MKLIMKNTKKEKNRYQVNGLLSLSGYIFLLLLSVIGVNGLEIHAAAAQEEIRELPQEIKDTEAGIVKLLVYAVDQSGKEYYVRQGTGILIGTGDAIYVLTTDQLVHSDEQLMNNIRRQFGLAKDSQITLQTDIVLQVGTRITTEQSNAGDDFVLLRLGQSIIGVGDCSLGNSSAIKANDKLYIAGYSGNSDLLGQTELKDNVIEEKIVTVSYVTEDEIITDYQTVSGDIGAPVMNYTGEVMGILAANDTGLYVKPINKVKAVLDVLGVSYRVMGADNHYNQVTDDIQTQLNEKLLICEELAIKEDSYTAKSIENLKSAITAAIAVTRNGDATYDEYKNAVEQLEKYEKKLRKKDYPIHMLQIGMGMALLLFIILGIRIQNEIKKIKEEGNWSMTEETIIPTYAKLIRMDTNQEIPITNVIFRIGKAAGGMDYVVENNSSISRHHADIMKKGNAYFILDNNSTNYTYVNDERAMPGEYVSIKGGDTIRLSDISYRFEV